MVRKTVLFLLVAMLLLTGCTPTAGNPTEAAAPAETSEVAATESAPAVTEAAPASGEEVEIIIESWRTDESAIWEEQIIPAFNAKYAGQIRAVYSPTNPDDYNSVLGSKLQAGQAGDVFAVRPFDLGLALYNQGYLADVTNLPGMENFDGHAKSGWVTDDGSTVYSVPLASVIHGFIYNKDIFTELGLSEPTTMEEFFAVLDAIKADGRYTPLAIGSKDLWEAESMGYDNFGPNYWKGEEGRKALLAGTKKFTDPEFLEPFQVLAQWEPYLVEGHEALTYSDAQNLFTLGKAAIYPSGSWEIAVFDPLVDFEMGAFPPPLPEAGATCYLSDHVDIAMGLNTASQHPEEAKKFLEWMTTEEFANLYSNAVPGFFSLSTHPVTLDNALANEFASWKQECQGTIRLAYQFLGRGEPNVSLLLESISSEVMGGRVTPEDAAQQLQEAMDSWYVPQK